MAPLRKLPPLLRDLDVVYGFLGFTPSFPVKRYLGKAPLVRNLVDGVSPKWPLIEDVNLEESSYRCRGPKELPDYLGRSVRAGAYEI